MFQTPDDRKAQREIADALEKAWGCKVADFGGHASEIDYYAHRGGNVLAVIEIKSRKHESDKYPTLYLSMRKWLALLMASIGMGAHPFFVAGYSDNVIRYINAYDADARNIKILGRTDRGAANDQEPIIEVPIKHMRRIS